MQTFNKAENPAISDRTKLSITINAISARVSLIKNFKL